MDPVAWVHAALWPKAGAHIRRATQPSPLYASWTVVRLRRRSWANARAGSGDEGGQPHCRCSSRGGDLLRQDADHLCGADRCAALICSGPLCSALHPASRRPTIQPHYATPGCAGVCGFLFLLLVLWKLRRKLSCCGQRPRHTCQQEVLALAAQLYAKAGELRRCVRAGRCLFGKQAGVNSQVQPAVATI